MVESLRAQGFQVEFHSHARAILSQDFPAAVAELKAALSTATIPIEEIIAGGGGESKGTQRLRRALAAVGWKKMNFQIEKRIVASYRGNSSDPEKALVRESLSHEVDHVRSFGDDLRIALEIEWNNKDPFFDRDLENFKRLHADGAISVGVIITRGQTLHASMRDLVRRFIDERTVGSLDQMQDWGYEPTARQRKAITDRMLRSKNPSSFQDAFADVFVADKFGEATTHWRKLEDRVLRGVGNPCPLLLIGLPDSIVTFHEGRAALSDLQASEAEDDGN